MAGFDIFDFGGLDIFDPTIRWAGAINIFPSGDPDDYIQFSVTSNVPLITGVGNYLALGKTGTAGSATSADDIFMGGALEVDGAIYADGGITGALTMSALTAGRVVIAGTGGLLADDGDFTFATDTLTVTKIGAFEGVGVITLSGSLTTGIDFTGTYTGNAIDFTDVTINHTGSNGPCLIRAGTYAAPVANADEDQSGMIRLYSETSAGGTSYDRGVFVCSKTTGTKGIMPVAGLAEVLAGGAPTAVYPAQFIAHLNSATASLGASAQMFGGWFKITANDGATIPSTARAAPIWIDNQLYGNNAATIGEEYAIFSTAGGTVPKAWAGFETTSAGWAQLFYFDETAYDQAPISSNYFMVMLDTTQLYIPTSTTAGSFTGTLGAITLAGAIAGGDQAFTGVGDMTFTAGSIIAAGSTNADTLLFKAGGISGTTFITLTSNATDTMNIGAFTLDGKLTAGAVEIEGSAFDIDGGTVDAGLTWTASQNFGAYSHYINDTANANMTIGLTAKQTTGLTDQILTFKHADVATVLTTAPTGSVETDDYATFNPFAVTGGLLIQALGENAAVTTNLLLESYGGQADTTKSTAGRALVEVFIAQHDGANALSAVTVDGNIFGLRCQTNNTVMLVDEDGDLWLNGRITTGGATPNDYCQNQIGGNFTSGGTSSEAYKLWLEGTLTGANGDTTALAGMRLHNVITTQTATESIGVVSQLFLQEPRITDQLGGAGVITVASTLHIADAPTEGTTNAAIYVASGDLLLAGAGTCDFRTGTTDGNYIQFLATDDDGAALAQLEVARMFSANDPYFSMGGSQEFKFTNGGLCGFFGATPVNQCDAYTQTYATADRTVAAPTCVTMGDLDATSGGWGASSEANFDKITTAVDQIIADNLDLRQAINAIIDDLQELGLAG